MTRIGKMALIAMVLAAQDSLSRALRTDAGVVRVDLQKDLVQRRDLHSFADDEDIMLSDGDAEETSYA